MRWWLPVMRSGGRHESAGLARSHHARHHGSRQPPSGAMPPAATLKVSRDNAMAEAVHEVSHGDILYKLGGVEGKIDTLAALMAQKQADLGEAFRRLSEVEKRPDPTPLIGEVGKIKERVAQGVILLAALAFFAPLLWQAMTPRLHFGQQPPVAVPVR